MQQFTPGFHIHLSHQSCWKVEWIWSGNTVQSSQTKLAHSSGQHLKIRLNRNFIFIINIFSIIKHYIMFYIEEVTSLWLKIIKYALVVYTCFFVI